MTPSGIKPETFWFVAQSLNQLRHCGLGMDFKVNVFIMTTTPGTLYDNSDT
jgi:hypothetical protein